MTSLEVHATTHVGRVRKGNEDNYLMLDASLGERVIGSIDLGSTPRVVSNSYEIGTRGVVLAVSDGMGGALAGEVASRIAVETVSEIILKGDGSYGELEQGDRLLSLLFDSVVAANESIHLQGRTDVQYQGMGATFTGVVATHDSFEIVQVGDSRAYLINDFGIHQITKDQSLVQQLVDTNQITSEEAETHALRNVILQALGAQFEVFPTTSRLSPNDGDILLICSDGLSNKVSSADLRSIVLANRSDLAEACRKLVETANENGGEDNITVILARISNEALPKSGGPRIQQIRMADIHDTE